MARPRRKHHRGFAMPVAPLALAVLAAFLAEQTRFAERAHQRHEAEGVAQRIDSLAWHLDHWIHGQPALTRAVPTAPRRLTSAETALVVGSAAFASPWLRRSDAVTVDATPPASANWQVRFAVGWPSGQNPAAAGTGAPYGVVLATALNGTAEKQTLRVREALRRRGSGVPEGQVGSVATGAAAVDIAQAAGLTVDSDDVIAFSWRHGRIRKEIALRRPRAGLAPPGMTTELELAGRARIDHLAVTGDVTLGSVVSPGASLEATRLATTELRSTALEVESDTTVAGTLTAATLDSERFESPTVAVNNALSATFRLAAIQGNATGTAASVQAARVRQLLDVTRADVGLATGTDLETPILDLSAGGAGSQTRVTDRFYARHLRLTGSLVVSSPGSCHGCLNDP